MTLFKLPFFIFFTAIALLFLGCGNKPVVKVYDEGEIGKIGSLAIKISPYDREIDRFFRGRYRFVESSNTVLYVVHKENICCNSNQNAAIKAVSGLPHNFLRMEVKRGMKTIYSYYIDLDNPVGIGDLQRAFDRLERDLKITP